MTRYLTRDRIAVLAALAAPLAVAAVLLPFRASWSNTKVALLLVVVVVGVAVAGNRAAGGLAAVWAALWFDFFFTVPSYRFTIRSRADVTTAVLLLLTGLPGQEIELRTFGNGQYYGRFMLQARPGSRPSLQARLVAVTLAGQAGQAFGVTRTTRSVS
jgi:hypothetical protein